MMTFADYYLTLMVVAHNKVDPRPYIGIPRNKAVDKRAKRAARVNTSEGRILLNSLHTLTKSPITLSISKLFVMQNF